MFSDDSGGYRFESDFPPPYVGRPPHIHIRVTADGHNTLVTQHYPVGRRTEATMDFVLIPVR
jgi:protocatechuate 3,4-dioxygenase beta subunit